MQRERKLLGCMWQFCILPSSFCPLFSPGFILFFLSYTTSYAHVFNFSLLLHLPSSQKSLYLPSSSRSLQLPFFPISQLVCSLTRMTVPKLWWASSKPAANWKKTQNLRYFCKPTQATVLLLAKARTAVRLTCTQKKRQWRKGERLNL